MCLEKESQPLRTKDQSYTRISILPHKSIFAREERTTQDALMLSKMEVYASLMTSKISLPVKSFTAPRVAATNLFSRYLMLSHVRSQIVNALEPLVTDFAIELGILRRRFRSSRSIE